MAQQTLSFIDYYKQSPRKKKDKIILASVAILVAISVVLLGASYGIIYGVTTYQNRPTDYKEAVANGEIGGENKIHFLSTGSSDHTSKHHASKHHTSQHHTSKHHTS